MAFFAHFPVRARAPSIAIARWRGDQTAGDFARDAGEVRAAISTVALEGRAPGLRERLHSAI